MKVYECAVTSKCHGTFLYITRPKKHFKNEQRSKDAAAKKDLIYVE